MPRLSSGRLTLPTGVSPAKTWSGTKARRIVDDERKKMEKRRLRRVKGLPESSGSEREAEPGMQAAPLTETPVLPKVEKTTEPKIALPAFITAISAPVSSRAICIYMD